MRDPKLAMFYLERGRAIASSLIKDITPERRERLRRRSTLGYRIRQLQAAILREVQNSKFSLESAQISCGSTELKPNSIIRFSTTACGDIQSELDIAWLILHESLHHVGVESEFDADWIATEIVETW